MFTKIFVAMWLLFACAVGFVQAQIVPVKLQADKSILGTYDGAFEGVRGGTVGTRLIISSMDEEGNIAGTVLISLRKCGGSFPSKGKIEEGKITIIAEPGGSTGDCNSREFRLTRNGNELKGQMTGEAGAVLKVTLSKL